MRRGLETVAILAGSSWRENLRGRFLVLVLVFGLVSLYMSLLLGLLAADQELRVLLDFGLALIELLGLAAALYGAATGILREMETKTIYLILTRPVGRGQFLLGRFLGLALSVLALMAAMALAHLLLLLLKGWSWDSTYLLALLGAFLKILVTASLALFLSLFSSSVLTALVITLILWTLGHFLPEIRYLIRWGSETWSMMPLTVLSYLIPDLQLLNLRDRLSPASGAPVELSRLSWLLYAGVYASVWLAAARWLLKRKEF